MAADEVYQKVLEHLKKDGPFNTFQLATNLDINRSKLLNLIEKLEKAGAVEVQHGTVKFLKFVTEGKKAEKPAESRKAVSRPGRKAVKKRTISPGVQVEKELKEKILWLESKVKELEKKASASPKIIKKTIVKNIIQKVPFPSAPPSLPKKEKRRKKRKIEKVKKKRKKEAKIEITKRFKLPKFTFMKKIKQLKKPGFVK